MDNGCQLQKKLRIYGFILFLLLSGTLMAQNKKHRIIKIETKKYNTAISDYEADEFITYSYKDGRGSDFLTSTFNSDTATTYNWVGLDSQKFSRIIKEFNGNNNLISQREQKWNISNSKWENQSRTVYNYTGSGNIILVKHQLLGGPDYKWVTNVKNIYTYDSNRNLLQIVTQVLDYPRPKWYNRSKTLYTYNNNKLEFETRQRWNRADLVWEVDSRIHYFYTKSNQIDKTEYQIMYSGIWESMSRRQFSYSNDDWLTTAEDEFWDKQSASWLTSIYRTQYIHNAGDYYYSSIIQQEFDTTLNSWVNSEAKDDYTFTSFNKVYQNETFELKGGALVPSYRKTYFYEEYSPTGLAERKYNQLKTVVFPNPAINAVNFQFENPEVAEIKLTVYDAVGRLVSQQNYGEKAKGAVHILWNAAAYNAKSGMYIYQLKAGNSVSSGQFMVQ